jgi:hypothetical protein
VRPRSRSSSGPLSLPSRHSLFGGWARTFLLFLIDWGEESDGSRPPTQPSMRAPANRHRKLNRIQSQTRADRRVPVPVPVCTCCWRVDRKRWVAPFVGAKEPREPAGVGIGRSARGGEKKGRGSRWMEAARARRLGDGSSVSWRLELEEGDRVVSLWWCGI